MFAQTKFVEFTESQIPFSDKDKAFISFSRSQESSKSIKIIKTPDLISNIDANGAFQFELPQFAGNVQTIFTADVINVDYKNSNEYFWTGKIRSGGSLLYAVKDGIKVVSIQTETNTFEIISINPDYSVITEVNTDIDDVDICGTHHSELPPLEESCSEINRCEATVTVLVLFNDATAASFLQKANGNTFAAQFLMQLGFESVNFAFKNSDIPEKKCKFIYKRTTYSSPYNSLTITLDFFSTDPEVLQLKSENKADLVLFLDNKNYGGGAGAAAVIGGTTPPGFGLVESFWLLGPRWTGLHEIGHLFGADHSTDDLTLPEGQCNRGHFIIPFDQNPTIMASYTPGRTRQLHYSNPNILFKTIYPTGTLEKFNASIISHLGCQIQNYIDDSDCQQIDIGIIGNSTLCSSNIPTSSNFDAEIRNQSCFDQPFSYQWRFNKTGIQSATDPIIGNSNSLVFNPSTPGVYFLFLTIETSGLSKTVSKTITVANLLNIAISGKSFACIDGLLNLSAEVLSQTCNSNAFTYAWRCNQTGIFNASNSVFSTNKTISFNPGVVGEYYVFLTITSSSGAVSTITNLVKISSCGPSHSKVVSANNNLKSVELTEDNRRISLQLEPKQGKIMFQVTDISGRFLLRKQLEYIPNQKTDEHFELNNNGVYLLTIWDGTEILNKKIIIQN